MKEEILASIDLGSNTILLAVVSFGRNGKFRVLAEGIETPRIGKGLSKTGVISEAAIRKLLLSLKRFLKICRKFGAQTVICAGTEAMRRAGNRRQIVRRISEETGLRADIISPTKEARLSHLSATAELPSSLRRNSVVIDIGAASTEVVASTPSGEIIPKSFPIGVLKLKELFGLNYPVAGEKIFKMRSYLKKLFDWVPSRNEVRRIFAVGGTATTVPSVLKRLRKFSPRKIDFAGVTQVRISKLIGTLAEKPIPVLKRLPGLPSDRADIFLPGLIILDVLLKLYGAKRVTVRNRGVRYGLLFDKILRSRKGPVKFRESVR